MTHVVVICLLTLLAITAVIIVRSRSLCATAMLAGIYSFLGAGWMLMLDAPDVAFTEAAVGAGISTVTDSAGHWSLRDLPVGQVARTVAGLMALPTDVDWQLRRDDRAAFLREQDPIGEQLEPDARVTLSPRTHLGGAPDGRCPLPV